MGIFLSISVYAVYLYFGLRLISHALIWFRASGGLVTAGVPRAKSTCSTRAVMLLDVFSFRRLFEVDTPLWFGSWTFHLCFFLVAMSHLRYFLEPVPGCIACVQPFGIAAGYVLPLSLLYILTVRLAAGRKRYVSYSNYFILILILLISVSGIMLRLFFRPDLIGIKAFIIGMLGFSPGVLPESPAFLVHFILLLLLVPYLPFHIFTAPLVTMEARRRDDALRTVMHD
ncbi:MAG: hypothetical protein HZA17_07110 [Nitrospirae bacterium]|nr:hypothetical protein [Nitrospirota bacterium]